MFWFIFLLLGTVNMFAQSSFLKGKVQDDAGEPLIGVSIQVKGTSHGTITDLNGNFSLQVSSGETLVISYIGYVPQEISINNQATLNITLKEDTQTLDEVVVVGFGTQKKVNLTGSVGVATAKDIESRPVKNLSESLQGLVPGMQITRNAGDIHNNMSMQIRGIGTIGDGSSGSPLILVDGMEGDINSVNPQDVESISVLKDAASASIYGSRAAFGVVIVTTKKGNKGKVNVTYNNNFRFASPIGMPKSLNSVDFMMIWNEGFKNAGQNPFFPESTIQNAIDFQAAGGTNTGGLLTDGHTWGKPAGDPFTTGYANTDWYKEMYKDNVFSQEHNAAISGGSSEMTYYASIGHLDYNGLLRHGYDGQKRYTATGKFTAKLASWVTFNYSARFIRTDTDRPSQYSDDLYGEIGRQTWPNLPVYDENGYYHNSGASTPAMRMALGGKSAFQNDKLYQQASLVFEPIKNWFTHVEFNYSIDNDDSREIELPIYNHLVDGTVDNTNGSSTLYQRNTRNNYMNWNVYTDYNMSLQQMHNFKFMFGFQSEELRQKEFTAKAWGLQDEELPELNLTTGLQGNGLEHAPEVRGFRNQWSILGFFGRINYDYNGKYLTELNLRHDGSSRFRKDNRWTWSPSASIGWNIAREDFWEDLTSICNTFKLRASYGTLANQNTKVWYPTYRTMNIVQNGSDWLQDGKRPTKTWVSDIVSSSLTWEKVRTWNFGLDWGLFKNRLSGSYDYFIRFTNDMVGPSTRLPATLGVAAPKTNNCDLRTNGWELQLTWRDNLPSGLSYSVTASLSDAKNVIQSYPGNPTQSLSSYIPGRQTNEIWGFETVGIAKSQEEMDAHLASVGGQEALGNNWAEGDIMFADLDGQPGITRGANTLSDHGDLKLLGNSTPRYQYGIDLSAQFKGFDIRAFFQGIGKRDIAAGGSSFWGLTGREWFSVLYAEHMNFYRSEDITFGNHTIPAKTDGYFPRILHSGKNQQTQSKYLQDGSYIRLKNLQVGYTIPSAISRKFLVQNIRLYVSADNLWTHTNLIKIYDPETIDGGREGNAYPLTRTWSFGLSINF